MYIHTYVCTCMLMPKVNSPVTYVLSYVRIGMYCTYLVVCSSVWHIRTYVVPQIHTYIHTYVCAPMLHVAKVGMLLLHLRISLETSFRSLYMDFLLGSVSHHEHVKLIQDSERAVSGCPEGQQETHGGVGSLST